MNITVRTLQNSSQSFFLFQFVNEAEFCSFYSAMHQRLHACMDDPEVSFWFGGILRALSSRLTEECHSERYALTSMLFPHEMAQFVYGLLPFYEATDTDESDAPDFPVETVEWSQKGMLFSEMLAAEKAMQEKEQAFLDEISAVKSR